MRAAIWWVRRDLRLTDNRALDAALAQAEQVVSRSRFKVQLSSGVKSEVRVSPSLYRLCKHTVA